MNYVCKNCGKFVTEEEYKKEQEATTNALGCGCLLWIVILLCCVSVILLPIAIILILKEFNKVPNSTCPYCQAKNSLIPENTPIAQKLISENFTEEEQDKIKNLKEKQALIIEKNTEIQNKNKNLGFNLIIIIIILYVIYFFSK